MNKQVIFVSDGRPLLPRLIYTVLPCLLPRLHALLIWTLCCVLCESWALHCVWCVIHWGHCPVSQVLRTTVIFHGCLHLLFSSSVWTSHHSFAELGPFPIWAKSNGDPPGPSLFDLSKTHSFLLIFPCLFLVINLFLPLPLCSSFHVANNSYIST